MRRCGRLVGTRLGELAVRPAASGVRHAAPGTAGRLPCCREELRPRTHHRAAAERGWPDGGAGPCYRPRHKTWRVLPHLPARADRAGPRRDHRRGAPIRRGVRPALSTTARAPPATRHPHEPAQHVASMGRKGVIKRLPWLERLAQSMLGMFPRSCHHRPGARAGIECELPPLEKRCASPAARCLRKAPGELPRGISPDWAAVPGRRILGVRGSAGAQESVRSRPPTRSSAAFRRHVMVWAVSAMPLTRGGEA